VARPLKQGVDYFPLDVILDDKFELIEAVHGVAGFGVVVKLYQKIYGSGYYLCVDERFILMLSKRINVDINLINAIINDCVKWGLFDRDLYENHQVLTSKGIQKRYFEIVTRRKEVHVDERFMLVDHKLPEGSVKLVNVSNNLVNDDINSVNTRDSTQREREIKGKLNKSKSAYSPEFETWWSSYPKRKGRKVGKGKAALLFNKIHSDKFEELKQATANYSKECNGLPKDAERFLRNDFWKDYLEEVGEREKGAKRGQKTKEEFNTLMKEAVHKKTEQEMLGCLYHGDRDIYSIVKKEIPFLFNEKETRFGIIWRTYTEMK